VYNGNIYIKANDLYLPRSNIVHFIFTNDISIYTCFVLNIVVNLVNDAQS